MNNPQDPRPASGGPSGTEQEPDKVIHQPGKSGNEPGSNKGK
jgi:hypothetical protein